MFAKIKTRLNIGYMLKDKTDWNEEYAFATIRAINKKRTIKKRLERANSSLERKKCNYIITKQMVGQSI